MALLATDAYRFALSRALSEASESISLISAYVTTAGIEWVLERLPTRPVNLRVIARWRCADLASKASDLEVYPLLRSRGARLYVHPDVHAKLVLVDNRQLLIGSANLTSAGLQLVPGGNREIGVALPAAPEDLMIVENLFDEAVEIDPNLYEEMRAYIQQIGVRPKGIEAGDWPLRVAQKLTRPPARVWVAELLWSSGPADMLEQAQRRAGEEAEAARHDLALLGFGSTDRPSLDDIRDRFLESRAWRWLEARLLGAPAREMYFGELSARLHDLLLDDPRPYRKEVKNLVSNLLDWAVSLAPARAVLDRPAHSQRLRLLS